MTARNARSWVVITLAILTTLIFANHYATTGHGFTPLAVSTLIALALILAWARRCHLEETRS